jgi:predicted component of type VI protein secretion system
VSVGDLGAPFVETADDVQRMASPVGLERQSWPGVMAKRPLVVLVTVVDTDAGRMFSRTFAGSPIRIGSHRSNDLRLRHREVARCHGEIGFEAGSVWLRNRAWTRRTLVDEAPLARGEAVTVTDQSVIVIGPFRIDVSLCKPRLREAERSRRTTPLVLPSFCAAGSTARARVP